MYYYTSILLFKQVQDLGGLWRISKYFRSKEWLHCSLAITIVVNNRVNYNNPTFFQRPELFFLTLFIRLCTSSSDIFSVWFSISLTESPLLAPINWRNLSVFNVPSLEYRVSMPSLSISSASISLMFILPPVHPISW